jgi:hypothetical protein
MSEIEAIEPGVTWRERAGRIVLDPRDPRGNPLTTPADRRWLWRIGNTLAGSAGTDELRQLAADLRGYLDETCEHHDLHYDGGEDYPPHDQCLWCGEVGLTGDAANQVARILLDALEDAGEAEVHDGDTAS